MATSSVLLPGIVQTESYAPRFRVTAAGRTLDAQVLSDVLQVKVTMEKDGSTIFNLSLNNWDEDATIFPKFKYSDGGTFDIGVELCVEIGYADELVPLVTGRVNSLIPSFPESGTPTVEVTGADSLFRLKGSKPQPGDPLLYKDMADWQIAQQVAARNKIPIKVTREGPIHSVVIQKRDQDDAAFLLDRAKRIEFDLFMRHDRATRLDTLHFVKRSDGRDATPIRAFAYEWGRDLIEFSPRLSVAEQVSSVTVRGWDPKTKRSIEYTATERDLPKTDEQGPSGPAAAASASPRGKTDVIVDASVLSEEEARQLAVSRLVQKAYSYKTGSGRVMGQPEMRPGDNLDLRGLGRRFSGLWHVTKVDHSLGSSGYLTTFEVERLRESRA